MRKELLTIASLVLYAILAQAQGGWVPLDGIPDAIRYDDVYISESGQGWTVNGGGEVFHTSNGGENWSLQATLGAYLRAVVFMDDMNGFIGSVDGIHWKTADGGETWEDFAEDIPGAVPGLCGLSSVGNSVFGVGAWFGPAYFIRSQDAGESWSFTDLSSYADAMVACKFVTEEIGFIGGLKSSVGSVILRTTDGGDSWDPVYQSSSGSEYIWKFSFPSDEVLYAAIEPWNSQAFTTEILKSTDGGNTWTRHTVDGTQNLDIQGIGFLDENTGWVGPRYNSLYETNDGGESWTPTAGPNNINQIINYEGTMIAAGSYLYQFEDSTTGIEEMVVPSEHGLSVSTLSADYRLSVVVDLFSQTNVRLDILDVRGRVIQSIEDTRLSSGEHYYEVDISDLAQGQYFICLLTNEIFQSESFIKN